VTTLAPFSLSIPALAMRRSAGAAAPSAPITSANADGITVIPLVQTNTFFPDDPLLRVAYTPIDKGYNSSGVLTDFSDKTRVLIGGLRLHPYEKGNATDFNVYETVDREINGAKTYAAAISIPNFVTTTIPGRSNNSTRLAPKPTIAAITTDRITVRNDGSGHWYLTIDWAAFTYKWRGQQTCPYLEYRVTDSAGTVGPWKPATWVDEFTGRGDRTSGCGFTATEDLAAYADGVGFVDFRALPAMGDDRSIRSTLDTTKPRGVKPFYFRKSSVAATDYFIASTGSDSNNGLSRGAPFLTGGKFLNAATAAGAREDAVLNVMDSVAWGTTAVTADGATTAYVNIQKDPQAAAGTVVLSLPNAQYSSRNKYTRFLSPSHELKVTRTAAAFFHGLSGGRFCFDGAIMDGGGFNAPWTNVTGTEFHLVGGGENLNYISACFAGTANINVTLMRGLKMDFPNGAGIGQHIVFCCDFNGVYPSNGGTSSSTRIWAGAGLIVAFNRIMGGGVSSGADLIEVYATAGETLVDGYAIVGNETEWSKNVSGCILSVSRDPPHQFGTEGGIRRGNIFAGTGVYGRGNVEYDNNSAASGSATVVRYHISLDDSDNVYGQHNSKGGQFVGTNDVDITNAPLHIANMETLLGVGKENNVILFLDAAGGRSRGLYSDTFSPLYAGLNAYIGTATTTRFDVFAAFTGVQFNGTTATSGAGGSDLRVKNSSAPQHLHSPVPFLPRTLGGGVIAPGVTHTGCRGLAN
jgi:hypothetical protein